MTDPSLSRELDRRQLADKARDELDDALARLEVMETTDPDAATMRGIAIHAYTKLNRYTDRADDLERIEAVVRELALDREAWRLGRAAGELNRAGLGVDEARIRDAVIVAADTAASERAERALEELSAARTAAA
jgi:hypothetical protein